MNAWQITRQLRYLLRAAVWPDGAGEPVFGASVYASVGVDAAAAPTRLRFPGVLLAPGSSQLDPDQAELEEATFSATLLASVPGDWTGEAALIGGARAGGQGSSGGRGILELEEVLRDTIARLDGQSGIRIQIVGTTEPEPVAIDGHTSAVARRIELEAQCSVSRTYEPPRRLTATDGSGSAVLAWELPADRYDRNALVLRRAAGSTPPVTVTDGDSVTVGALVSTLSDTGLSSGTYSYSLFMGYDELGGGTSDRYSVAATATVSVTAPTPDSILGAKLAAWFDASDAATITSDANGISAWADKVSGNPSATQAADAKKPNVSAAAINGLDAILFDFLNQEILECAAPVTGAAFRVFVVGQVSTVTGVSPVLIQLYDSGGGVDRFQFQVASTTAVPTMVVVDSGGATQIPALLAASLNTTHLLASRETSPTNHGVEIDGANEGTSSTSRTPSSIDTLGIGGRNDSGELPGLIGEIVVVDESAGVITAQQLADLETYLERWGLTIP